MKLNREVPSGEIARNRGPSAVLDKFVPYSVNVAARLIKIFLDKSREIKDYKYSY